MKLISESIQDVEYICEENDGKKTTKFVVSSCREISKTVMVVVYPKDVLMKEVGNYNRKFVDENRAFGELGHPDGPTVNLERVSHLVTSLKPDGSNVLGEARILETPMGKIVKTLMDEGTKLGVSSRGMGSLDERNGAKYVRDDFYLAAAADIVADPSAPNAFVEGVMEGKEWVWNNGS